MQGDWVDCATSVESVRFVDHETAGLEISVPTMLRPKLARDRAAEAVVDEHRVRALLCELLLEKS
jgi:hypothetical protein